MTDQNPNGKPVLLPPEFKPMPKPTPLPKLEVESRMEQYWTMLRWRLTIVIVLATLALVLTWPT